LEQATLNAASIIERNTKCNTGIARASDVMRVKMLKEFGAKMRRHTSEADDAKCDGG